MKAGIQVVVFLVVLGVVLPVYAEDVSAGSGSGSNAISPSVRNPFGEVRLSGGGEAGEESVVFNGSGLSRLPSIKVCGMMTVGGATAVCAEVSGTGSIVLRKNEKILLGNEDKKNDGWFVVRELSKQGMVIELHDGTVIEGKFF